MSAPVIARSIAELNAIPTIEAIAARQQLELERLDQRIALVRAELDRQAEQMGAYFEQAERDQGLLGLAPKIERLAEAYLDADSALAVAVKGLVARVIEIADETLKIYPEGSESLRLKRSRLRLVALRARLVARERRHEPHARLVTIAKPSRHEALVGLEAHAPPPLRATATPTYEGAA